MDHTMTRPHGLTGQPGDKNLDLRDVVAAIPGVKVTHYTKPANTLGSFGVLRFEWNGSDGTQLVPRIFIAWMIDKMVEGEISHFKVGVHTPGLYSMNWLYHSTTAVVSAARQVRDRLHNDRRFCAPTKAESEEVEEVEQVRTRILKMMSKPEPDDEPDDK